MTGREQSDRCTVPKKLSNKGRGAPRSAETVEGRDLAKGNSVQQNRFRTQCRANLRRELNRVREAAKRDKRMRFTALWHHVYKVDRLREAYFGLKRAGAPGVDGQTWQQYGEYLDENLKGLSARLKTGAYQAKPVRRVYIPKPDGRQRPIGVPALEDKIVQRASVEVLNAVYETDFLGFSYGFRPGRSQHNALDAVTVGLERRRVNWVFDADIRGFFDAIDHDWLVKFIEHRIADQRVVRHVKKWLNAGVLEDGKRTRSKEGTPQGGSVSPLLANVYLHYVFDLWAHQWRKRKARGEVIIVRFADDAVAGFQYRSDAERFRVEVEKRFRRFNLELHPDKTRLIEFGRYAAERREKRGSSKPETFNFLGLTHICGQRRKGGFKVLRRTERKRARSKLREVKAELWRRLHQPVPEVGRWLASVIRGHTQYYGVPGNSYAIHAFRYQVIKLWHWTLRRRSQKHKLTWERMQRLIRLWIPSVRICHPYPANRLVVGPKAGAP
jgi:RNA-directed DNA polymerase